MPTLNDNVHAIALAALHQITAVALFFPAIWHAQ